MKNSIVFSLALVLALSSFCLSCTNETKDSTKCAGGCPYSCNSDIESVLGILYQQQSAEYRALCYQAYNLATQHITDTLEFYKRKKETPHFAIITDLDETALDNSAESAWLIRHDSTPAAKIFGNFLDKWQVNGLSGVRSDSVPGSVSFFKWVKSKGIEIYYITNRLDSVATLASTMKVMDNLGFPEAKDTGANKQYFLFRTDTSSKELRRNLVRVNHKVILLLGDDLADHDKAFDGGSKLSVHDRKQSADKLHDHWGVDYIVFPNAVYGDWEQVLYKGYKHEAVQQSDSLRFQMLDTANTHNDVFKQ